MSAVLSSPSPTSHARVIRQVIAYVNWVRKNLVTSVKWIPVMHLTPAVLSICAETTAPSKLYRS